MSPCSIPNVPLVLLLVLAAQMRPLLWLVLAHAWKLLVGMSRCFQEPPSPWRDVFGLLQGWLLMPGTVASQETVVALKHRHKTRAPDGVSESSPQHRRCSSDSCSRSDHAAPGHSPELTGTVGSFVFCQSGPVNYPTTSPETVHTAAAGLWLAWQCWHRCAGCPSSAGSWPLPGGHCAASAPLWHLSSAWSDPTGTVD